GITAKIHPELRERILQTFPEIKEVTSQSYITTKEYEMALRVFFRNHEQNIHFSIPKRILHPLNLSETVTESGGAKVASTGQTYQEKKDNDYSYDKILH
ncbi:hypothetical protein KIN20_030376, partial [Parelaphostrongylus tenuis]